MIHLRKVDETNAAQIVKLSIYESQYNFVASNETSLREAKIANESNGHAFPFGIYDD